MNTTFVPEEYVVPRVYSALGFTLKPLTPEYNSGDYEAWSSSISFIHSLPDFADNEWPSLRTTRSGNIDDLSKHQLDFERREGFTYTVLQQDVVIGCIYIYPDVSGDTDARIRSWVRSDQQDRDALLREAVVRWISTDWPFHTWTYGGVIYPVDRSR